MTALSVFALREGWAWLQKADSSLRSE